MVAVRAANRASGASIAPELGSLVHARLEIADPRWRLEAVVGMLPALRRFGVSLDVVRPAVREAVAAAVCPQPLRDELAALVLGELDHGATAGLSALGE